ncbi:MAG TPA: D-alanyl-D-alanine carboxypeptidase [Gammaproteobacteria bacterium]|nr:D-alanyl-D-alanine carboxypeptidase [Gammaproteobacteria bacterium]
MIRAILFLGAFFLASFSAHAERPVPAAPQLSAKSYLLGDFDSGKLLVEKDIHQRMEPASLTKMMSSYVISQALRDHQISLDDKVRISRKARAMEGSRMFVEAGSLVSVSDLLKGMIVQSGNDATVALAEHVGGTEDVFVSMMNAQAEALGMRETHFTNSTGLPDPEHYTTAADLFILTRALIRDFPEEYSLYSVKHFEYNKIKQSNRNRLLWTDKRVDGVKTGHTQSAGFCLVASGKERGMRLISVVLGTDSDDQRSAQSRALLNYGFRFFETRKLYVRGQEIANARVWKGDNDKLSMGVAEDVYLTFPRGRFDQIKATLDRPKNLIAPIGKGQAIGTVTVHLGDKTLREMPLIALNGVREGGVFRRLVDSVKLLWE